MRSTILASVLVLALTGAVAPARAAPSPRQLSQVETLLGQWREAEAGQLLASLERAQPENARVLRLRGEILFLQGRYERAREVLGRAERSRPGSARTRALLDLVAATAREVTGYVEHRSAGGHFRIFTSPGKDEILAPFAAETLERARAALQQDLGYAPKDPIRVEIYPGPEALARVSTLTMEEINRSGTIAICKFNRLMVVSPRALLQGYPWLDTMAHEYVHLLVSRLSHNRVPVWLHEGAAKHFEARWREPAGGGTRLSPAQEHLLAEAVRSGKLIDWSRMHPSMAKLPNQQDVALAFAQVQTALDFLVRSSAPRGVQRLLELIRDGRQDWGAIQEISGLSRSRFDRGWRQYVRSLNLRLHPGLALPELRFGKRPTKEQRLAALREARARRYLVLGDLLASRKLHRAAVLEYQKARTLLGQREELVAVLLARAHLAISSPAQAISALMPVLEYYPELPEPQLVMGIAQLRGGDLQSAAVHLKAALRIHPFNPEIHCNLAAALGTSQPVEAARHEELCRQLDR